MKERDELKKKETEWDEHYQAMRACIVYARDRRGSTFDFDEWNKMVEYALRAGHLPPSAVEDAQTKEAQAWAAVAGMRQERDAAQLDAEKWRARQAAEAAAPWPSWFEGALLEAQAGDAQGVLERAPVDEAAYRSDPTRTFTYEEVGLILGELALLRNFTQKLASLADYNLKIKKKETSVG